MSRGAPPYPWQGGVCAWRKRLDDGNEEGVRERPPSFPSRGNQSGKSRISKGSRRPTVARRREIAEATSSTSARARPKR